MEYFLNKIKKSFRKVLTTTKFSTRKFSGGFTLIEIMVAVSVFAMVMVVAITAILSIVSANKKAQSLSSVINNLNFSIEAMSRDLRTGYNYNCNGLGNCISGGDNITFKSSQSNNASVKYSLDTCVSSVGSRGCLKKQIGSATPIELTASEIDILELNFHVLGSERGDVDNMQPRILIRIKGTGGNNARERSEFNLQTTVSQRRLDI